MRGRILVGVGAWLAGAVAATGFSHLAVSLLGRGIASDSGQILSSQAINKALADVRRASSPAPSGGWPSVSPAPGTGPAERGILLASDGGTVVARCEAADAYLKSWSPAQGFLVEDVARGPARAAHVTFESADRSITMRVSCVAGTAKVNLAYHRAGWNTDDSGEPGDS